MRRGAALIAVKTNDALYLKCTISSLHLPLAALTTVKFIPAQHLPSLFCSSKVIFNPFDLVDIAPLFGE